MATLPTADQAALVQSTWAEAKKLGLSTVGNLFYKTMFTDFPELPETLFKGVNMAEQQAKLMAMLDSAVGLLGDLDTLVPILQESGVRHGGYGTEPRHYAMVGQSLMKTLAAGLGDKLTPDAKNAWLAVYAVMQHVMLEAQNTPEGQRLFAAYQRRVKAAAAPALPTADQAALVQSTWAEAKKLGLSTVGNLFYKTMFTDFPELPETLFKGVNMAEQQAKLMAMLDSAVGLLGDLDTLVPILQESGVRHGGYGTEPRHYAMVGQSLMKTLAAGLGDKLTPDAKNAWLAVYAVMQHVMLEAQDTPEGQRLFAAYQRRAHAPVLNDDGLPTYHLLEVVLESHNTRRMTFQGKLDLIPGGHMCVLDNGLIRNYTPYHVSASNPAFGGVPTFSIIVKKYANGPLSTYMHSLDVGSVVTMTGPKAPHALPIAEDEDAPSHVVLVGGGTGIAPVYSMAHSICRGHGSCPPKTTLIVSFANCAEALLVPELKSLQNVTVVWNFSRETHEEEVRSKLGLGDDALVVLKHLSATNLKDVLSEPVSRVLLCGPAGYNKNARHVFGHHGFQCHAVKTL